MKAPTVHLNGSSGEHLAQAASDAKVAAQTAREALQGVYPNGRDYYPQDRHENRPEGTSQRLAVDEFLSMRNKLDAVIQELEELQIAIVDQVVSRSNGGSQ